tara:strand:+ start:143 stop:379 length:237 start_codon:yes stop_codon:yes gene_type:complete
MESNTLYTKDDFNQLVVILEGISTHIPTDKADYIWSNYQKIANTTEGKPCSCGSSGGLWIKSVNTINEYIKNNKENYL